MKGFMRRCWHSTALSLPKATDDVCFLVEANGRLRREYGYRVTPDNFDIDDDEYGAPWIGYCDCYSDDRVKYWQTLPKSLLKFPE